MPTYEQLMDAARRADADGDEYAARRFLTLARASATDPVAAPKAPGYDLPGGGPQPQPPEMAGPPLRAPAPKDYRGDDMGAGSRLEAALIGARQGVTFGFGDEINAGVRALGDRLFRGRPLGEAYDQRLAHERGLLEQTRRENPASSFAGEVGGALLPTIATAGAAAPMTVGRGAAMGAAGSAAYGFGEGEGGLQSRARDAAVSGALGGAMGGATTALANAITARAGRNAAARAVPEIDDLKAQAGALYRKAEETGVTAARDQTEALAENMAAIARSEGLVSPTGRTSTAYPKVADALRMVEDYANGTMTPTQMQQVRKTMQKAAQSADGSEARVGTMMLKDFDAFASGLAPEFAEANKLYAKAMKGSRIEQAIELAGSRAGQFSGSGYENALRTEFRALERQIIKGQLKGLSQAEIDAIKKVANGGPIENLMRDIGKMAPRGVVSTGIAGGLPFMMGNAVGGPAMGAVAGGVALGAGEVGRRTATALQSRNAALASAIARNGGALQAPQRNPSVELVIQALIAAQRPATN